MRVIRLASRLYVPGPLPHSKGDMVWGSCTILFSHQWQYIETLSTHRRRDSDDDDIVLHIDDVRNGVILGSNLHRVLGQDFAILKVASSRSDAAHGHKLTVSLSRHRALLWTRLM